jgi:hypothetical protein
MADIDAKLGAAVPGGQMRADLRESPTRRDSANKGPQKYALGMAEVVLVDHKRMLVNLRILSGENVVREAVPISWPGAGRRHFFGSMPEQGDMCVVGWGMLESGSSRRPFIVAWVVPDATLGYDWLPTQPFGPNEFGLSPKLKEQLKGVAGRYRHKLRTMNPGNIVASSSQGSDLVLDESVMLSNRRGNEVRLRDQDQAFIVRSLQQFHAGAGFRAYSGMVQRDANLLPTQMFADTIAWEAARQADETGQAIVDSELEGSEYTKGFLTPDGVFQRDEGDNPLTEVAFPASVDPYDFLKRGLFIDKLGYARGKVTGDAIYGGKSLYRVSISGVNGANDTSSGIFTEHRIEVAHTADGTLPVTEQTDGFDANRLPPGNPEDVDPLGPSADAPFIESVLGTVVGNDPYTEKGRELYGLPLKATIFSGGVRSPGMSSAIGSEIETQAATLFSVRPPITPNAKPTFWSVAKDGRLMASIEGPGKLWSAEIAALAGIRIGAGSEASGRAIQADLDGAFIVHSRRGENSGNIGIELAADGGAVRIFAGGSTTVGGVAARNAPTGQGEGGLPGLILESATNVLLKASKTLTLSATRLDLDKIQELNVLANTGLNFQSGDGISHSSNTHAQSTMGKAEYTFSGPKNGLPTNGAVRDTKIIANPATGFPGGPADQYFLLYGDRIETLLAGNHLTTLVVGNQLYTVGTGSFIATATGSTLALSAAGAVLVGAATTFVAAPGATTIQAGALLSLTGATMALTAAGFAFNSVFGLHSIPPQVPGAVLTDGCINPITGLPFALGGTLGIQTIRVN